MAMVTILQSEAVDGDRRAAGLERLAVELEREAAMVAGRLDDVVRAFTDDVWKGPAATRAREALVANRARVRGAADELLRVAALLRRRAGDARAQSADLRRQADRLTAEQARLARTALPA
ncbi:MAG: hypothetical protein ACR2MO_11800 [Acidimicrobiales bacterium]